MSCGYTGFDFGSRYEDSICIDGILHDADSGGPGEGLTSPDNRPCPSCNVIEWIEFWRDLVQNQYELPETKAWENLITSLIASVGREKTVDALRTHQASLSDQDRMFAADFDHESGDRLDLRRWPWRVEQLTAHENILVAGG